ncbi:hypothetical protein [Mesorhizobium huakuii]|uniref:Uncharacterized protein n=1 Tax=Mesorhizobium huakuii TaxID=28104 RepID=A0ABZ0VRG1_9HYPH|nr:hypothetical protein [Mesorhizobium huakuii]WQB99537.1 hypothetical protein U0R22_003718 [Mesorhizobium huakuii]
MTALQVRNAQQAVDNLSRMGMPFDLAAWLVANWFKQNGIRVTEKHLELAFAHLR